MLTKNTAYRLEQSLTLLAVSLLNDSLAVPELHSLITLIEPMPVPLA